MNLAFSVRSRLITGTLMVALLFIFNGAKAQLTWQNQYNGSSQTLKDLFFLNTNDGWAVGTSGLVLYTTDGGQIWQPKDVGLSFDLHEVFFVTDQLGWIVGNGGTVLKTTDGGSTWFVQASGLGNNLEGVFFINPLIGWISGYDGVNGCFYRTMDGGDTWILTTVATATSGLWKIQFIDQFTGWVVGASGIYKSTDGGINWTYQGISGSTYVESIAMIDANKGWVCGAGGMMAYTLDGGTNWSLAPVGTADLWDINFFDATHGVVAGVNGSIFYTQDAGVSWIAAGDVNTGSIPFYAAEATSPYTAYVAGEGSNIFKSIPAANDLVVNTYHGLDTVCANVAVDVLITITNNGPGVIESADFVLLNGSVPILYYHWSGMLAGGSSQDISLGLASLDASATVQCVISGDTIDLNNISSKYIEVVPNPVSTSGLHTICQGDSLEIFASGGQSYYWYNATSDSTNSNQWVQPDFSTTFYVQAKTDYCYPTDSVQVIVDPCADLITAISPNGDGINDILEIPNLDGKTNSLKIYNRWGDLVNSFTNYDNTTIYWDGLQSNGESLNEGTYFYVFETDDRSVMFSSWVQIVR